MPLQLRTTAALFLLRCLLAGGGENGTGQERRLVFGDPKRASGARQRRRFAAGIAKPKAPRSVAERCRRQSLMFGSRTPVNRSRNRRTEVWSKSSLHTQPPAVHGETIMQGTRNPPPIGKPVHKFAAACRPAEPAAATWSKMPVVLVVIQDENRLRPHLGIGGDGIDLARDKGRPSAGM